MVQWRTRAAQMGITNLTLTGFVPNRRIPLYQAAAEILLMPYEISVSVSGGGNTADICSPMKMFEYMAAGRAILSSDLPVLHEVLDPTCAIFCPPQDASAWIEAFRQVTQDAALRARLGTAARAAVQGYSWRHGLKKAWSTYSWNEPHLMPPEPPQPPIPPGLARRPACRNQPACQRGGSDRRWQPLARKQVTLGVEEGLSRQIELEPAAQAGLRSRLAQSWRADWAVWLLVGALGVYLFTRLYALADYPIYFFTDEANQTLLAADLLRDKLRSPTGEFLPTYFNNVYQYNLGVSVYLQVIPAILFPRSIEITRGISALVTLLAPLWLGLALLRVYRSPAPWLGVLLLTITPAWFLHSRTAFETSLAVTFYAGLLYYYLRYRAGSPRAVYGAVLCAALAFYSYSPAQVVVAVTLILWGVFDLRFHWQNRAFLLRAAGLGLLCLLPYARFQLLHPNETLHHLTQLGALVNQSLPWTQKVASYFQEYLHGLSPIFWYAPGQDLARHIMGNFGNLLIFTFPLGMAAVGLAVWRWRRWEYRIPLLALLAVPGGAALVGIGVTRTLFMVIPIALLTALLSGELLEWAARRWHISRLF